MNLDFSKVVAVPKATRESSIEPKLTLTTVPNKFQLSQGAMSALGIPNGGYIAANFYPSETMENKILFASVGEGEGAKINERGYFNYSGLYGVMMLKDPKLTSVSLAKLRKEGLLTESVTDGGNKKMVAVSSVEYSFEEAGTDGDVTYFVANPIEYNDTNEVEEAEE